MCAKEVVEVSEVAFVIVDPIEEKHKREFPIANMKV
jgi:hypothetical protein